MRNPGVVDARQVLKTGYFPAKGTIIVIGGGTVGCEVALFVKRPGNQVFLVEQLETLANDMEPLTRNLLLADLADAGIKIEKGMKYIGISPDHRLKVMEEGRVSEMDFDMLIIALGSESVNNLITQKKGSHPERYVIGDAAQPGKLMDAIHKARNLALQVLT